MTRGRHQDNVARRVESARTQRGWSYRKLADEMAAFGVSIDGSSLQKIERGARRVDVDELVAFANIFRVPLADMCLPETDAATRDNAATFQNWKRSVGEAARARQKAVEAERAADHAEAVQRGLRDIIKRRLAQYPDSEAALMDLVDGEALAWTGANPPDPDDDERYREEMRRALIEGVADLRAAWAKDGDRG